MSKPKIVEVSHFKKRETIKWGGVLSLFLFFSLMTDNELGRATPSTIDITPTEIITNQQEEKEDSEHTLTRTSTIQSVQKKMSDLLDNPIFSGFLLILAGFCIAFQAGI